ncbi:AMP phosphorylase [Candidatus Micrarchaeota archaeon]|nr:MAG: AMP phosphorylase [Candidatus Micrarchaeota archaeon]
MRYDFKVKSIDISAQGKYIIAFHEDDAADLDVSRDDRIKVKFKRKEVTCTANITNTFVKKGQIGLFKEVKDVLNVKNGDIVKIEPVEKPESVRYIKKKIDGYELKEKEIHSIINDIMEDNLTDIETAAFITATSIRGMSDREIIALTRAIVKSGDTIRLKKKIVVDKHSIGGVPGNRTTLIIVPVIAAAGLTIAKTSSRSITSPAGTADTMEVLAPVALNKRQILETVRKCNACIVWGGAVSLAAADDKIIRIEHPLKIDSKPNLISSILAKKKAVGATHCLIDISVGHGAKVRTRKEAEDLARKFIRIGKQLGIKIHCIITPGFDPVGDAMGPALEAREILRLYEGKPANPEVLEKGLTMAGILLEMVGKAKKGKGYEMARGIFESGKAYKKLKQIIKAQGGDPNIKSDDINVGSYRYVLKAGRQGRIHYMNTAVLSTAARLAGAPHNKGAGIMLHVEKGDKIKRGQKILTVYAESRRKLEAAKQFLKKNSPIELTRIVLEEFDEDKGLIVYT